MSEFAPLVYTSILDIDAKHASIAAGFKSGMTQDLTYRRSQLRNLYYAIVDHEEDFKQALYLDLHRSGAETEVLESNEVLSEIKLAITSLESWAKDKRLTGDIRYLFGKDVLRKSPYGTVLIIGPWNYPYLCTIVPSISAIAAGNTVISKPSEMAPESAKVIMRVISGAMDPGLVQVVNGAVKETTHLLDDLRWDKIMFTGSGRVGKIVAAAAAQKLTPIALELGGKSPAIITKHAHIPTAAKRMVWSKFVNAGQTCVAPDYVIIDETVADAFVKEVKRQIRLAYPDPGSPSSDFAHIVTDRLFERAVDLVKESKGSIWQHGEPNKETKMYPPTIADNVSSHEPLMSDEIFGPILPIVHLNSSDFVQQAIQLVVENHDHPLALYVFTTVAAEQEKLIANTRSGAVMINDAVMQGGSTVIPFGGVGPSGTGRYHGKYGFDEFTHERPVVSQPTWAEQVINSRYAPYTTNNMRLMRLVSRPFFPGFSRTGPVKASCRWSRFFRAFTVKSAALIAILAIYYRHKG